MTRIEQALSQQGIELPETAAPVGAYVPALRVGEFIYTSGQLPFVDGQLVTIGLLGDEVDVEGGYDAARTAAMNALAAVRSLTGDLDLIEQIVKVTGFVASTPSFTDQPKVINGASEFFGEFFGKRGEHARSAVGVAALPMGSPVEIELIVKVRSDI
ncbi:RidA family protein [Brevibacterium sp. 5221]|uniref:RidA family protein n=1 Tax=Brevibacterium rongguiense TaxID=2695267 RepID=A0A6N9H6M1_9MICO|nr:MULTISPECIES: RidA family protein [Brevibacterium]MYM19234.1 RidA family protein [Brevibacterium rongguiense]WAL39179.1 RidA family protein [Brevibacterium sp. BRM-1]